MFFKECKKIVLSITYFIFIAVLVLFSYTQIGTSFKKIEPPKEGLEDYGTKYEENPEIIMPNAVVSLYGEFSANSYTAYPLGFYKNVKLNDKEQREMAEILSKLTGKPAAEMSVSEKDNSNDKVDISLDKKMNYQRFLELMKLADQLIGGGSNYSSAYLIHFGEVEKTYEDALADYNDIVEKDQITGALARLFSDYLGIVLSIFPVFVAAAFGLKDRRAKMQELIYTRKISSFRLVFSRYFAMVAALFLPVLMLAMYYTIQTASDYTGFDIDSFAFIKYSIGWLLPSMMVSTAVGIFLTELTDTPIAIVVQGIWWFIGMNLGLKHMKGGYGADLILRHNTIGNMNIYLDNFNILLFNRISYTLFSILLIILTVWIYERKRRGKLDVLGSIKKIFSHRKVELKA